MSNTTPTIAELTRMDWPSPRSKRCEICDEQAEVKSFTYQDSQFITRESKTPSYFCRACLMECDCENAKGATSAEGAD